MPARTILEIGVERFAKTLLREIRVKLMSRSKLSASSKNYTAIIYDVRIVTLTLVAPPHQRELT